MQAQRQQTSLHTQTGELSHRDSWRSPVLRRHGKKRRVPGTSAPGTGPGLQQPWAGRSAKDFDICWRKVPRETQPSPQDEMCALMGEHEVARRLGGGAGRRKGNS